MTEYPEHDKLKAIQDESQAVGAFLDTSGYQLCEWHDNILEGTMQESLGGFLPVTGGIQSILAKHYGIDQDALEAEKRAMLDAARAKG